MTDTMTEAGPVLLRALKRRWRGHYMVGPGEAAGDLFWWDGKGKRPAFTADADPSEAENVVAPERPVPEGPGGGPALKHGIAGSPTASAAADRMAKARAAKAAKAAASSLQTCPEVRTDTGTGRGRPGCCRCP